MLLKGLAIATTTSIKNWVFLKKEKVPPDYYFNK